MFLVDQRVVAVLRQQTLLAAVLFAVFQVMLSSVSFSSIDLLQVFTGPVFLPSFYCADSILGPVWLSDVGSANFVLSPVLFCLLQCS